MLRKLWKYSAGRRKTVVLYLSLATISNVIDLAIPLVIVAVANEFQNHGGIDQTNFKKIIFIFSLYLILKILFWLFHGPARVIEVVNAFQVKVDFKKHMVDGIMSWSFRKHSEYKAGDTLTRVAKAGSGLESFCSGSYNLVTLAMRTIGAFIILSYLQRSSMIIVATTLSLTILVIMKFDKKLIRQNRQLHEEDNLISERIGDSIVNIRSVVIHRAQEAFSRTIAEKLIGPLELRRSYMFSNESKWFAATMGASAMAVVTMIAYVYLGVYYGTIITLSMIMALWGYLMRIGDTLFSFAEQYASIVKYKAELESCDQLEEHFQHKTNLRKISVPDNWQEIEVRSLKFTHEIEGRGRFKLRSSGVVIGRGQKIALIGSSGSGKTTFLSILPGHLYQPDKAEIYLDGLRIEGGFTAIGHDIALIPQEVEIFSTTVRDNITMGIELTDHGQEISDEYIMKFTNMACFTEVLQYLPKGLDTSISDKGIDLSGGQKQRLALARALMHAYCKKIILIDEPTNNIDMLVNEGLIFDNIFKEFEDQAIVCAVHGLHLLERFDTIYLFDHGQVIASGTLSELIEKSPEFRDMWQNYTNIQGREAQELFLETPAS